MTGLLLATLLNLSPGIQLADNVASRHVALSEARLRLQFVSDDSDAPPSLDAMTRSQLAAELRRLDESRPSIIGPIVLLGVGGVLGVGGAVLIVTQLAALRVSSATATWLVGFMLASVGVIAAIAGGVLLIVGAILLPIRLIRRSSVGGEQDEIRRRMEALDQGAPPPPPPPAPELLPPPPPPPPPPQANLVVPGAMQTVLVF